MGFQNNKERVPQIGEVYLMKFGGSGSEQSGWRPGVVFQNNMGNAYSPNIIALPLTSSLKKTNQPTHVIIKAADSGLRRDSMVLCENPERMSKERLGQYITTLPQQFSKRLNRMKLRGMQTSVQETEKNCSQLSMRYLHCAPEASGCLSRY